MRRGLAVLVARIDIGPLGQQQRDVGQNPVFGRLGPRGHMEGGLAVLVHGAHVGLFLDEQLRDLEVAASSGHVQRRAAVQGQGFRVGPGQEQNFHRLQLASAGRRLERRYTVSVSVVDVGPLREQPAHFRQLPVFRRFKELLVVLLELLVIGHTRAGDGQRHKRGIGRDGDETAAKLAFPSGPKVLVPDPKDPVAMRTFVLDHTSLASARGKRLPWRGLRNETVPLCHAQAVLAKIQDTRNRFSRPEKSGQAGHGLTPAGQAASLKMLSRRQGGPGTPPFVLVDDEPFGCSWPRRSTRLRVQ